MAKTFSRRTAGKGARRDIAAEITTLKRQGMAPRSLCGSHRRGRRNQ